MIISTFFERNWGMRLKLSSAPLSCDHGDGIGWMYGSMLERSDERKLGCDRRIWLAVKLVLAHIHLLKEALEELVVQCMFH